MLRLLFAAALASGAHAWGRIGHTTIGNLAQDRLNPTALARVTELLGGQTLGDVANWADGDGKEEYEWSEPLHFINVLQDEPRPVECEFTPSRDCPDDACVSGSLANFTQLLAAESGNLTENLMFVTHFAGDIHQPLHTAFADDKGGLKIDVNWCDDADDDAADNLHGVWDYSLIERSITVDYNGSQEVWEEALRTDINSGIYASKVESGVWTECLSHTSLEKMQVCTDSIAEEGIVLACGSAYYGVEEDDLICEKYRESRVPIVRLRMAQGGVRLAALLNELYPEQ